MNLKDLTIKSFHEGLVNKEFSASEITAKFFSNIDKNDKNIGAYLLLEEKAALLEAKIIDTENNKEKLPLLAGVPLAIKDNILLKGVKTTAASKILENYIASYDAFVISKLKKEKVVFLGKTNLDEFAMGSSTENSGFQVTKNPFDSKRVAGGSSGGSAAAVASNMALAALGSDTGGSIRQPAAFCGVVGFRPTYGAVSRHGLIAMASSLDQIGPITKTVEDASILFKAIAGKDKFDATSVDIGLDANKKDFKNIKIGLPKEYFEGVLEKEISDAIKSVIKTFESVKISFKEVSLSHTKYAISCYYIIMSAEVSSNLARFDGIRYSRISDKNSVNSDLKEIYFKQRGLGFGEEVKRRVLLGTFVLSAGYYDAYYAKAQKIRRLITEDFDKVFDKSKDDVDFILTPVTPIKAFKIGEKIKDPLSMYLNDIFTIPASLAGLPALSIPVKIDSKLPVAFQLIGKRFDDIALLNFGEYYEKISK